MKVSIAGVLIGVSLVTAVTVLGPRHSSVVPVANATVHQDDGDFSFLACSTETIRGKYAYEVTGSIVSNGPIGLVADVGIISFDGVNGASQASTVSLNGTILHRASLGGSYIVNPDCTGHASLTLPGPAGPIQSDSDFVIVNHGQEMRTINTGAGRVLAGTARRQ
jgi:hypothetical protein